MKKLNLTQHIFLDQIKINQEIINYFKKTHLVNKQVDDNGLETSLYFSEVAIQNKILSMVSSLLEPSFGRICKELNFTSVEFKDVWLQKYKLASNHDVHVHKIKNDKTQINNYSFNLYLECTKKSGGTTFFNLGYPYVYLNQINIKPEVGKLIVFLGCLPHTANPSKDNKKFILAGNVEFK